MRTVRTLRALGGRDRERKRMALEQVAKTMVDYLEQSNWRVQPGSAGEPSDPLPRRREFPAQQLAVDIASALEAALARDPTILPALMSKIRPIKWDAKGLLARDVADRLRASWWFRHGPPGESAGGPPRPRRDDD
jgi:hypothetical protein